MKQEIVLPKFTVPGQGPNWVVRGLFAVGGLLVLQMGVLGIVMWKRQSAQSAAVAADTVKAQTVALAVAPAPAAAQPQAVAHAAVAQTQMEAPAVEKARPKRVVAAKARKSSGHRGKLLAKAGGTSSKARTAPKSSKPDAIDEILRKFK